MGDMNSFIQMLMQAFGQQGGGVSPGGNPGFREGPMSAPMYDPAGSGGAMAPTNPPPQSQTGTMNPMMQQFIQMLMGGGMGSPSGQQTAYAGGSPTFQEVQGQAQPSQTAPTMPSYGNQTMYTGGSPTFQENMGQAQMGSAPGFGTTGSGIMPRTTSFKAY